MKMDLPKYTQQGVTELGSDPRSPGPEPRLFGYIIPIQLDTLQHAPRACHGRDALVGIIRTAHKLWVVLENRRASCLMQNGIAPFL